MSNWPTNGNLTGKLSIGQGERGKSLEYMWQGTKLGIRVEGEEEYQFVNLAGGGAGSSGTDGREIELQIGNGFIQWRYKGEEEWNNLISMDSLKGDKGDKGERGEKGDQGIQGLPGRDGVDGKNGTDGQDGANGQDGITPIKGIDYYTQSEKEELITEILQRIPNGNEVAY